MKKGFLREHSTLIDYLNRFSDPLIAIVATLTIGRWSNLFGPDDFVRVLSIYAPILMIFIFPQFGLYKSWRGLSILDEVGSLLIAWLTVILFYNFFILLLANKEQFEVLWPFVVLKYGAFWLWVGIVFSLNLIFRVLLRLCLRYLRKKGYNVRSAVIVGTGDLGQKVNTVLMSNPWMGYNVAGFFDDRISKHGQNIGGKKVIGSLAMLPDYLKKIETDCIFITLNFRNEKQIADLLATLNDFTCDVKLVPDFFHYFLLNSSITELSNLPIINIRSGISGSSVYFKWCEDKLLALIFLIIASPVMLLISLGIKITSSGPVIFKQHRYGISGKAIKVYKFRTMTVCEDDCSIEQAKQCDPRVTPFGVFLRRFNFDELPQLVNVLQGRMSLVGPRPHAVAHNEQYRKLINYYMLRHKVKPGITGWAQVNGWRGETEILEKMEKRIEYDFEYINNWSLWFDIKIIFLTMIRGFNQKNAY